MIPYKFAIADICGLMVVKDPNIIIKIMNPLKIKMNFALKI